MTIFNSSFAELIVKRGLPFILVALTILILLSVLIIKLVLKKPYFNYVTEHLIEIFDCEQFVILKFENNSGKFVKAIQHINAECSNIKVDPTSIFIQFPYYTRFLSYILFWSYFSIQTLFLEEIFTDQDLTEPQSNVKCFNMTFNKLFGSLYRCEKYGVKSLTLIFSSMDQIAGILALHELNKYVFRISFKFFKWCLLKDIFRKFNSRLIDQYSDGKIPRVSYAQINYVFLVAYLSYVIYDNIVTEHFYVPIKFVCYSVLIYSTILSSYETVKYLISQREIHNTRLPLLMSVDGQEQWDKNEI